MVSVDTKKKELVGQFRNGGREWRPKRHPEAVKVHDFPEKDLGKAIPYGVDDQTENTGWVSVGVNHDTAEFAVETLRRWWRRMGIQVYPGATKLQITADGGGSNGSRCRLWKVELQGPARRSGCGSRCAIFRRGPASGTRSSIGCFSQITENWRGRPLLSREVVVNLIGHTKTKQGRRSGRS